ASPTGNTRRVLGARKQRANPFLVEKPGKFLCHRFATSYGIRWVSAGTSGRSKTANYATSLQGGSGVSDSGATSHSSIPMRFRHPTDVAAQPQSTRIDLGPSQDESVGGRCCAAMRIDRIRG